MKTQQIQMEKFEVIPDSRLYGSLGQVGHSLRNAISELVDNAIDARIPGKKLTVEIDFDEVNQVIRVNDNGRGMDKEMAKNALILGKSSKKGKLGFFGLGLKTAGLSLGNIITVKTKPANSNEVHVIEFDREDFENKNNWELSIKSLEDNLPGKGTTIIISDLLVGLNCQKADRLNDYFANRYRSFINSEEIEISVNGFPCFPVSPEYIMEQPISLKTFKGNLITGMIRLQTKRLQKKMEYGFDLYKNKRIIISFDKIGLNGVHGEKALICGELNFDFCPVNFTKNAFLTQSDEYKNAERELEKFLKPLRPLFSTKNLKKEKIEKLLAIQSETGKIPNLEEFKELVKTLDEEKELDFPSIPNGNKEMELENSDEELQGLPKIAELSSQVEMHLGSLGEISQIAEEADEEMLNEISSNPLTKMKLSTYAGTLIEVANQIKMLLQKAKPMEVRN